MDWSQIIMNCLFAIAMALISVAWKSVVVPFVHGYLRPWIIEHNLTEAAKTAVLFAEAEWGRGHGKEKLEEALKSLANKGWDIDSSAVISAVEAAWQDLNIKQVGAGIKPVEVEEVDAE